MKRKLVYFPIDASSKQVVVLPSNSEILGIDVVNRIPHLLILEGTGSNTIEIPIGIYKTGQNVTEDVVAYIGTFTLNNQQGPTFHCLIHKP